MDLLSTPCRETMKSKPTTATWDYSHNLVSTTPEAITWFELPNTSSCSVEWRLKAKETQWNTQHCWSSKLKNNFPSQSQPIDTATVEFLLQLRVPGVWTSEAIINYYSSFCFGELMHFSKWHNLCLHNLHNNCHYGYQVFANSSQELMLFLKHNR